MKRLGKSLLQTSLALFFIYLIFLNLRDVDIKELLWRINPSYLLLAYLFYLVATIARVQRIKLLYSEKAYPFSLVFAVSSVHTLISNLLPSRLGEVSFVVLMKRVFKEEITKNVFSLLFIRLLDLFMVVVLFLMAGLLLQFSAVSVWDSAPLLLLTLFFGVVSFYLDSLIVLVTKISKRVLAVLNIKKWETSQRLVHFLEKLSRLRLLREKRLYWKTLFLTALIWLFLSLSSFSIIRALGFNLSFTLLIFSSMGAVLTSLLPLSVGAFGTYELGWVGVYTFMGLEGKTALLLGFALHVINLLFAVSTAVLGAAIMQLRSYSPEESVT